MLRTILLLGLCVFLGLIALRLVFGVFGWLISLVFGLLMFALWIGILGLIVYLLVRVLSPSTARKIREKFGGEL